MLRQAVVHTNLHLHLIALLPGLMWPLYSKVTWRPKICRSTAQNSPTESSLVLCQTREKIRRPHEFDLLLLRHILYTVTLNSKITQSRKFADCLLTCPLSNRSKTTLILTHLDEPVLNLFLKTETPVEIFNFIIFLNPPHNPPVGFCSL